MGRNHLKDVCQRFPDANGDDHPHVQAAYRVFKKIFRRALRQPDVVGVDIGYMIKEKKQRYINLVGIRFHVESKLKKKQLKKLGRANLESVKGLKKLFASFADEIEFDKDIQRIRIKGIPTDVIEAQYAPYHLGTRRVRSRRPRASIEIQDDLLEETARGRVEPLMGGVSIGRDDGPAGTLGLIVHDRTDGKPCILANWHVLAGFKRSRVGEACFQPAVFDGGIYDDHVGHLKRWLFDETADAALADLDGARDYATGSILGMWFPVTDILQPWLGLPVKKWGRTTGYTEGFVDGVYMATDIPYGQVTPRTFEGQIHIAARRHGQEFSDLGDSGSAIIAELPVDFPDNLRRRCKETGEKAQTVVSSRDVGGPFRGHAKHEKHAEKQQEDWNKYRKRMRAYYVIGLLFAGDTAASRFGEFALAHPMLELSENLEFSIQPVLVPERDMVPQVHPRRMHPYGGGSVRNGGTAPQPVGVTAGQTTTAGGPQPIPEPIPPDEGP